MSTPAAAALSGDAAGAPAGAAPRPASGSPGGGAPGPAGAGAGGPAGGAANQTFYDSWLPQTDPAAKETREWLANKNFRDPASLATSYRNLETEASSLRTAANLKGYPAATKDAQGNVKPPDAAQLKAWDTAMGVPATPDLYDFGDLSKIAGVDPEFVKNLASELHGVHTPAALATVQAAAYERAVAKTIEGMIARENAASAAALEQMKVTWGANYSERVELGKRAQAFLSREAGGISDEQFRGLEQLLGTDKMMTFFWKVGAMNKELPTPPPGDGHPPGFSAGTSELQSRYAQLQADRTAGKVSTEEYRKQERELADQIVAGFAGGAGN